MKKYFNDAVIGNKNLKASYTKKGELLRLMYPEADYRQFIDFFRVGIHINDSNLLYLHDDINNTYKQWYEEDTNILNTEITNTYFKLKIEQTDFIPIKQNILIKKYKFINQNNIDIDINFLVYSKLLSDTNNKVAGYCKNNMLLQYMHDYRVCTFSKNKIASSRINNSKENIDEGDVDDKDYVGLSADSSIRYELSTLKPKEEKEIVIFICIDNNESSIDELQKEIDNLKRIDVDSELDNTKKYWRKYVKEHNGIILELADTPKNRKIEEIYKRTILLYPLLTNYETGGISAAIEVDEEYAECGRI